MISIVIPTFNEIRNISEIINQLLTIYFSSDIEIIIVDDYSVDNSKNIIKKYKDKKKIKIGKILLKIYAEILKF